MINITGVLRFVSFGILGNDPVPLWWDNEVVVMVTKDASSEKRMAYVARRIRFMQELQRLQIISIFHGSGKANPADSMTKHLGKVEFRKYMSRLYNVPEAALL